MQQSAAVLRQDSELSADGAAYIEDLYEQYLISPSSVSDEWRTYFDKYPKGDQTHSDVREQFLQLGRQTARVVVAGASSPEQIQAQVGVVRLIEAYRTYGHKQAKLDPLGLQQRSEVAQLKLEYYGLSKSDLDKTFHVEFAGKTSATLKEIIDVLQATYCNTIGAEYVYTQPEEAKWLQQRLETAQGKFNFSADDKKKLLSGLTAAEGLEKYLANKYVGVKRFGLEGGESYIPMVQQLIQSAGESGVKEVIIGMAHRGRLNTLVNVMGKKSQDLFDEFDGKYKPYKGSSDVKYHMGFSSDVNVAGNSVHLALAYNPSHLEIVAPVVEGSVRARKDRHGGNVLPIIVHGDAALAGQGVNQETFQMSQTRGYGVGGSIHIAINNQVGFTTSNPLDARSTEYCTDVAKMISAPVFHVNGDDPEAVIFVTKLAHDYRHTFGKDVFIDLVCYRRRGHNEADEPMATQPVMYQVIRKHPTTCTIYADKLVAEGVLSKAEANQMAEDYRQQLERGEFVAPNLIHHDTKPTHDWDAYIDQPYTDVCDTTYSIEKLKALGRKMAELPEGFKVQPQVAKVLADRLAQQTGEAPLNWGAAETLAYATLLAEGRQIRISGEDVGRGTFSHRHIKLHEQVTGQTYLPLCNLAENQPMFEAWDSLLSEEAALAFEYGYSTNAPKGLTIWEAQFGDFVNGAQMVIDQFICSGETKWEQLSGLTMLLPHGFEGQGPEHSSARLERFLQLCAEENMQVMTPTTPAQIYHALRRQVLRNVRKPMIIMSPKSLLRHKLATSDLDELANGSFQTVINEIDSINKDEVTRLVICGGKVYYDLLEKRRAENLNHIAIVRIEQLYPYPADVVAEIVAEYPNVTELVWAQEEPKNQGAWFFVMPHLYELIAANEKIKTVQYAGREAAAAPACGSASKHAKQQAQLVNDALGIQ
ncbi:2-oxoglutarate dehydrogenase E1 component [Moraxella sp. ZY210820]|uniref:2-oxoglutarate dehydrogenase E1 component n=1 Tax=unclassified Moraxella TaxID=2685852 RepID=UPI002730F07E|nr:2-oxoglutarate dehydrogenase E1 component [Moraxella sp. ZY210820]WLF84523.1 2-oxoglutarate dehydrogenase E1 component [Moraxella sp. ZY210820]